MSHDAASPAQAAAAAERERILVCDDDPRMRETIVEALAAEAFDVDTADRAVDAIQRIMRTSYRALILDLKLPGPRRAGRHRRREALRRVAADHRDDGPRLLRGRAGGPRGGNLLLPGQAVQPRGAGRGRPRGRPVPGEQPPARLRRPGRRRLSRGAPGAGRPAVGPSADASARSPRTTSVRRSRSSASSGS